MAFVLKREHATITNENVKDGKLKPLIKEMKENSMKLPRKPMTDTQVILNVGRPAFGEVGNKLITIKQENHTSICTKQKNLNDTKQVAQTVKRTETKTESTKHSLTLAKNSKVQVENKVSSSTSQGIVKKQPIIRQESTAQIITIANFRENTLKINPEPAYSVGLPIGIVDVDDGEDDPMLVVEYVNDIMNYLLHLEHKYPIKDNYLISHKSTPRMRCKLINWLSEVQSNLNYTTECFHMVVAIIDRYLQIKIKVGRETLQLVGLSALFIAAKYEELLIPDVDDYVYLCENAFSGRQILKMEKEILKELDFSLGRPLSIHFLRRFNKVVGVDPEIHALGKYILELALLDYELCHIFPSKQAAAACCLALAIWNEHSNPAFAWTKDLVFYSTYTFQSIRQLVLTLASLVVKAETSQHQAVREKYNTTDLYKISINPKLNHGLLNKLSSHMKAVQLSK